VTEALEIIDRNYSFHGAAAEYLGASDGEVLCEAGARSGKSFSIMAKANWTAREYPGCRQLFAMATRVAMNTTILPDWENLILWPSHPCVYGGASLEHREKYVYPNGSTIDLIGMDRPEKILSGQWDRIYVYQCEQVSLDAWQKLLTRLSCNNTPYRQQTADVNPVTQYNWLNVRGSQMICLACGETVDENEGLSSCPDETCGGTLEKLMRRVKYRHQDNPLLFDHGTKWWTPFGEEYMATLQRLTGVDRDRLLNHQWVADQGLVLKAWDPGVHLLSGKLRRSKSPSCKWELDVFGWDEPIHLVRIAAGVDWGYDQDPGVISVWGFDRFARGFQIAQIYRLRKQIDWWAEKAEELREEFDIRYFACDPSRGDLVEHLNARMTGKGNRDGSMLAIKANNSLTQARGKGDMSGIDLLRWALHSDVDGRTRMYYLQGNLREGADPELRRAGRPTCSAQEIPAWTLLQQVDGRSNKDQPDPACDEHGLDSDRYCWLEEWGKRSPGLKKIEARPGSMAAMLKHPRGRKK